ncbi:MAG TPA: FecR family protein [Thermodesulfobacteriota bacterium]|nr:FecR family protein [Thermodesulfobacteriota bacterium]
MFNESLKVITILRYLLIIILSLPASPSWSSDNTASVSFLEGSAFKSKNGKDWKPLSKGHSLNVGDSVKTGNKSRLELTLPDGSKVRFSENTNFKVEASLFKDEERSFGVKMFLGKVWAKVSKAKKVSSFEVKTANAVAGVKGTTYRIDVEEDTSSLVRVYDGEVVVGSLPIGIEGKGRKPEYVPGPTEVPGPHEVTREEWTYIVKSWQQITISPIGIASKPVSFTREEDRDEWVAWNQEKDKS